MFSVRDHLSRPRTGTLGLGSVLCATALLAALQGPLSGQVPDRAQAAPAVLPASPEVLSAFSLLSATVQELRLPAPGTPAFRVEVVLGGVARTLDLGVHDLRAHDFLLLVEDETGLHEIEPPPSRTYRGTVEGLPGSLVAASIEDGGLWATIHVDGGGWAVQPASPTVPGLGLGAHVVYDADAVHVHGVRCGVEDVPDHRREPGFQVQSPTRRIADIALDLDFDYFVRNNRSVTETVNAAQRILNSVDLIYDRDALIRYQITAIIVRQAQNYTNLTDPQLLHEFRDFWNANHTGIRRAMAHRFTGAGTFSGVVGRAYLTVVCDVPNAYGYSRAFASALATNVGLVAHELGHNWSAPHCDSAPSCNIMCAGLGGCSRNLFGFAPASLVYILDHKQGSGRSCLRHSPPAVATDILYFKFDEAGGDKVVNYGSQSGIAPGEGQILSNDPAGSFASGILGVGALRGGASGRHSIVDTGWSGRLEGSFSVAWWMRERTAPGSTLSYFFSAGSLFRCFTGGVAGDGLMVRGWGGSPADLRLDFNVQAHASRGWTHVLLVVDASPGVMTATWRVNGVLRGTIPITAGADVAWANPSHRFRVGGFSGTTSPNLYDLDEFRFVNRAPTTSEIANWVFTSTGADSRFGMGCGASLNSVSGPPRLGNSAYSLRLAGEPNLAVMLGLGADKLRLGGVPLPLQLTAVHPSLRNCWWEVGAFLYFPGRTNSSGLATFGMPIPNDTALTSAAVYFQGLVLGAIPHSTNPFAAGIGR